MLLLTLIVVLTTTRTGDASSAAAGPTQIDALLDKMGPVKLAAAQPETEIAEPRSQSDTSAATEYRIIEVQPGQTAYELILEAYGEYTDELAELVAWANPNVADLGRIQVGQELRFPHRSVTSDTRLAAAEATTATDTAGADLDEARRRRDLVMPTLWGITGSDDASSDVTVPRLEALPLMLADAVDGSMPVQVYDGPVRATAYNAGRLPQQIELGLEDAIEIALRKNLSLNVARYTRDAVATTVPQAQSFFHPTLGIAATATNDDPSIRNKQRVDPDDPTFEPDRDGKEDSRTVSAFVRENLPTGGQVTLFSQLMRDDEGKTEYDGDLTVSVTQPLLRGGGFVVATRPISDARYDVAVEEARLRRQVLEVMLSTKTAYYATVAEAEVITSAEQAIERDHQLIEASGSLFSRRLVTKRDVYSAEIQLADDKATLAESQERFRLAKNDLLDVLGLPISHILALTDDELAFQPISMDINRWIEMGVRNRPEVLVIEELLLKSDLNIDVARNSVYPQLDVVGSYGRNTTASSPGGAYDLGGRTWTAGLVFSFPLGNVGAREALSQAEIEHSRLRDQLRDVQRLVEVEVRAAALTLVRNEDTAKAFEMKKVNSEGKLEVAKSRFALGVATNFDITDSQQDLLDAEIDLVRSIRDYNIGLAELERRVGGPI